jgi:segregation and condensation protein B
VIEDLSNADAEAPETGDASGREDAPGASPVAGEGRGAEETTAVTPAQAGGPPESPSPPVEPMEDEEESAPAWVPEPDKLLCSLLFASHEYLTARGLREIMGDEWDTPRLRQLVRKLNRDLQDTDLPFEVIEIEGTFRMRTLPRYFPWTRKLFKDASPRRLSQAALETLAIVAYKQPITKAEIESIRGVNVDGSLKTLLDKKLIDIGRRSDSLGQAFTYHTTRDFLRYFGINRMPDDLPRLSEFEGILNAQSLIPQMGADGEVHEVVRAENEPEQMSLGMGAAAAFEAGDPVSPDGDHRPPEAHYES